MAIGLPRFDRGRRERLGLTDASTGTREARESLRERIARRLEWVRWRRDLARQAASAQGPRLISLHVPKTAGTTFLSYLRAYYGQGVVEAYATSVQVPEIAVDTLAVHGHFPGDLLPAMYPSALLVTWLRDPVRR